MHARAQIREAVVAKLKAGVPSVSERVFVLPVTNKHTAVKPFVVVRSSSERIQADGSKTIQGREYRIAVDVYGQASVADDSLEDALDAVAVEVEAAMVCIGAGERAVALEGASFEHMDAEGFLGCVGMDFCIRLSTSAGVADVII